MPTRRFVAARNSSMAAAAHAVVVCEYTCQDDCEVNLVLGEQVTVVAREGDWWFGVIDDRRGWFPATFVKVIEEDEEQEADGDQDDNDISDGLEGAFSCIFD